MCNMSYSLKIGPGNDISSTISHILLATLAALHLTLVNRSVGPWVAWLVSLSFELA